MTMNSGTVAVGCFFLSILSAVTAPPITSESSSSAWKDFWFFRLCLNLFCYASVVLPAYYIIQYLKSSNRLEKGNGACFSLLKTCIVGNATSDVSVVKSSSGFLSSKSRGAVLAGCFVGLQVAYLTWGLIQERIMTKKYGAVDGVGGELFTNSQFLVFVNRLLALAVSGAVILFSEQPKHGCPLFKFSYASFSNIMSSWFQYEALKFVSFPTQVLGKACKVIPVMIMGKIISGNKYQMYEWITAGMLSVGISFFLLGQGTSHDGASSAVDEVYGDGLVIFSGFFLMLGYMAFDSFTSNWQGQLFKVHKMSPVQMMFGVNLFSCAFTAVSLLEQGGFFEASAFMLRHFEFAIHSVVLSMCSGIGQLFIFFTISQYGAVVFTIIMTLRQALAILLSCVFYNHPISLPGFVGIFVIFAALFLRVYARSKTSKSKSPAVEKN